jgi:hypothetical protein
MRLARLTTTIMLILALACMLAAGASAKPHGVLSKAEYQQLLTAEHRVKALSVKDPQAFKKAAAICARIRKVSPLVSAVRSDCVDLVAFGSEGAKAENATTHCALDPASEQALLRCLLPTFRTYYADAQSFYRAELHVAKLAAARGFGSKCVAVIGDSPRTIAAEAHLVGDLRKMVNALKTGNLDELQGVSNRIDADSNAIDPGPVSLSLCPHR